MRFRLMPATRFYPLFKEAADNAVGCATVLRAGRPAGGRGPLVEKLVESSTAATSRPGGARSADTSIVTPFD
jgi:hypothetical protein